MLQTDQAWAKHIRTTRHIGSFTNWKDRTSYQKRFERLLRAFTKKRRVGSPLDPGHLNNPNLG
jgi:hypothetical protein